MASKRHKRKKECGDKKAYDSYKEANEDRYPERTDLVAYGCRFCGKIHLGHPPATVRQGLAAKFRRRFKDQ